MGKLLYRKGKIEMAEYFEDEIIILMENKEIHCLNQTAKKIWEFLLEGLSVEEISDKLSKEYGISSEEALADTKELLSALESKGLVEKVKEEEDM